MLKEFRDFVMRGNVIDLAVGIIIGAAFNDVVNSLVDNIIMAPLGAILGRVDFSEYYLNLSGGEYDSLADAQAAGAATINYGLFIGALITFLIIALAVFLIIKAVNRAQAAMPKSAAEAAAEEAATKECPFCFTAIPAKAIRCPNCTTELEMAGSGLD
ncbi:MAG TPA: large conductance mechanosensitive channel protein MscL [Aggregatilineales bacterium]|nr:large conductance mechanosensitive channel protein MscL [Aggregatilineales bacterium]